MPIDVAGDGDHDVVLATDETGQFSEEVIYFERTPAGFGPEVSLGQRQLFDPDLVTHDWDRDGDDDIVLADGLGAGFHWFEQVGGTLAPLSALPGIVGGPGFVAGRSTRINDADRDGDLDFWVPDINTLRLYRNTLTLGSAVCPGRPNSVGDGASLVATGTELAQSNGLVLTGSDLPPGSTAFFLVSRQTGQFQPPASQGVLCLGGAIGRYTAPGQIQRADPSGVVRFALDLTLTPDPTQQGPGPAMAGETLYFQGWYRDANPQVTSNFTGATGVLLRQRDLRILRAGEGLTGSTNALASAGASAKEGSDRAGRRPDEQPHGWPSGRVHRIRDTRTPGKAWRKGMVRV